MLHLHIFSLGANAFSRAYFNFLNREDLLLFTEKFDGYEFLDSRGKFLTINWGLTTEGRDQKFGLGAQSKGRRI